MFADFMLFVFTFCVVHDYRTTGIVVISVDYHGEGESQYTVQYTVQWLATACVCV